MGGQGDDGRIPALDTTRHLADLWVWARDALTAGDGDAQGLRLEIWEGNVRWRYIIRRNGDACEVGMEVPDRSLYGTLPTDLVQEQVIDRVLAGKWPDGRGYLEENRTRRLRTWDMILSWEGHRIGVTEDVPSGGMPADRQAVVCALQRTFPLALERRYRQPA